MRELNLEEVEFVDGASLDGAMTVIGAAMVGAAVGTLVGGPIGTVAGAISAGGHAFVIWNAVN